MVVFEEPLAVILLWVLSPFIITAGIICPIALFNWIRYRCCRTGKGSGALQDPGQEIGYSHSPNGQHHAGIEL